MMTSPNSSLIRSGEDIPDGREVKLSSGQMPPEVLKQKAIDGKFIFGRHDPRTNNKEQGGSEHFHWIIQGFVWVDADTGTFYDTINISVEASDENSAMARAMRIVDRPGYRLVSVSETCSLDDAIKTGGD